MTCFNVTIFLVMNNIVMFSQALADPTRWRIVRLVMEDALCVCELADILKMPQSSVSSHVQIIRRAGLLESEKNGKWTYFTIQADSRKIIRSLVKFFSEENDTLPNADTQRLVQRLAERESSCCPGPKNLIVRKTVRS